MKKMLTIGLVMMLCAGAFGCTNMSKTQQGVASGAAIGALGGAGIATISGGSAGWGALAGGAAGMGVSCRQRRSAAHRREIPLSGISLSLRAISV